MKDIKESKRVRKLVKSEAKHCYRNAVRVLWEVPEYSDADYVEGLAVLGKAMVIEHGWVEKDGVIVDPTLPDDHLEYFPGLRFHGERGLAEALHIPNPEGTSRDLPFFFRFGWGGIDSPEFRAALIAAYRYAGAECVAERYETYKPKEAVVTLSA